MRALITGAAGFAGSHLVDYLIANTDWQLFAFVWERESLENLSSNERTHVIQGDICREDSIRQAVQKAHPDYIFHLAAIAAVGVSFRNPGPTMMTNILGQVNLLQAVLEAKLEPRILIVGSADEYGQVAPEELPIKEDTPLRPANPYAVSKVTQDLLGYQYFLSYKLPIVRVRPFNHIGPRQQASFVVAAFAKQVAAAELGLQEPVVRVGNLTAERDFSDVRDMVRGYYLAITRGKPGEVYNLASEKARSIQSLLEDLVALSRVPLKIETDPARFRPVDVPVFVGDCSKFRACTGWRTEIPFAVSLQDVLDYWRQRLNEKVGEEK